MLCLRPFFPRDCAALFFGMGQGCAPQESNDTEVVPPEILWSAARKRHRKPWRAMLCLRLYVSCKRRLFCRSRLRGRFPLDSVLGGLSIWQIKKARCLVSKAPGIILATTYSRTTYRSTTIGSAAFHFRVRDGNGWVHCARSPDFAELEFKRMN